MTIKNTKEYIIIIWEDECFHIFCVSKKLRNYIIYNFEKVNSFTYLGSPLNNNKYISLQIRKRISKANKTFSFYL